MPQSFTITQALAWTIWRDDNALAAATDAPAKKTRPAKASAAPAAPVTPADGVYLYLGCSPLGIVTSSLNAYVQALDARTMRMP